VYPSLSISLGCTAVPVPEDPEPEAASL
jgi:hypothetical protein